MDALAYYHQACQHDAHGKEADAAPAYEKAIELGLPNDILESAYLGLGSTYRALGDYQNSRRVFETGMAHFPENRALKVFYSMTLYNLGDSAKAMEILLQELAQTSEDEKIKQYRRALMFYSDKLSETFA